MLSSDISHVQVKEEDNFGLHDMDYLSFHYDEHEKLLMGGGEVNKT